MIPHRYTYPKTTASFIALAAVLVAGLFMAGPSYAKTRTITYHENSDYELTIYYIEGESDGNTMMIIGGIQGDEPGGYLAADLYADMLLKKGNLIVVPRANFYTIKHNNRGVNGDMNRKFGPEFDDKNDYDSSIVHILKDLINRSDVLLNLHEGSGFYYPEWKSNVRNPNRYGQSIIADADSFTTKNGNTKYLKKTAERVIEEINRSIENPDHTFRFNNHNTLANNTQHPEQRKSATYYALTQANIPAFGLETSKSITSLETKVRYQTLIINAFMNEYDIVPEHPSVSLPSPELDHLVISVIGQSTPLAVKNGSPLRLAAGNSIQVMSVIANYKRGLYVDIEGYGNSNDLGRVASITGPTTITVYKDAFKCGEIPVLVTNSPEEFTEPSTGTNPGLRHLACLVNGKNMVVSANDTLHITHGDVLCIQGAEYMGVPHDRINVNFVGFVGNSNFNDVEDRGYPIRTGTDLIKRFSADGNGYLYRIETLIGRDNVFGTVWVSLETPVLKYVIVERGDGSLSAVKPGTTLYCGNDENLVVREVVTSSGDTDNVSARLKRNDGSTDALSLPGKLNVTQQVELIFTRGSVNVGSINIRTRG